MTTNLLSRASFLRAGLATLAVGTAQQAHAQTMIKADGGRIRLLANPAGTQSFPPYVIKKFRLDTQYGFELQVIPASTSQASATAVQSGGADLGVFDWADLARMQHAGVKLIGVAPFLIWANTVVVPVDSPIHSLADLKGRKLGVWSRTALDWLIMKAVARNVYNMDLEKEVTIQEGAPGLLRGATEQGQLDATQMFNSLTPDMVASGKFRVLVTIRELVGKLGVPDTPFLVYGAQTDYAAAHPDNVRAFLAAYRESLEILRTNDALWLEKGKEMKMATPTAINLFRDEARADLVGRFEPDTEAQLRKTFDILLAAGGKDVLGMTALPPQFLTMAYQ